MFPSYITLCQSNFASRNRGQSIPNQCITISSSNLDCLICRALAVDLYGQLIILYNAIFPCLYQLKKSDAPELISLSALPSSLPDMQSPADLSTDRKNVTNFRYF